MLWDFSPLFVYTSMLQVFCLCLYSCSFIFLEAYAVQVFACTNGHPGMQGLVITNKNSISPLLSVL